MPQSPKRAKGQPIPSRLDAGRLSLTWTVPGEDEPRVIDLSGEPGSVALRLDMLRAFEEKTKVDWRETATVFRGLNAARHLLGKCDEQGIGSLADLQVDVYAAMVEDLATGWSEATLQTFKVHIRSLLLVAPNLPIRTAWFVGTRTGGRRGESDRAAYTRDEFLALADAAQRVVSQAHRRITRAYADAFVGSTLPAWRDLPAGSEDRRKRLLWLLLTDSERPTYAVYKRDLGSPSVTDLRYPDANSWYMFKHWFLLTAREASAAATLLTCREGYNTSTIDRLTVADRSVGVGDPDSEFFAVLNDKARRTSNRYFTSIHEDSNDDIEDPEEAAHEVGSATLRTGRVFRLLHEATDPARHHASARGLATTTLLIYGSPGPAITKTSGHSQRSLMQGLMSGVPDQYRDGGWIPTGLHLDFQMLHRTYQVVIERAPTHNTRNTHTRAYLAKNPEARAQADATARDGFTQSVATAHQRMALRISAEAEVSAEVNSGLKDTATVACADITHHPVTGTICRDNFLMCLACTNAIATARHVPRLALLHGALEDLRSTMTSTAWEQWRDDYLRLHAFLVNEVRLDQDGIREAAQRATRADRLNVSRVLEGALDVDQ